MDFFQLDKVRSLIEVDHCYTSSSKRDCDSDEGIFNLSPYHSPLEIEESCLDVGGSTTGCSFEEKVHENVPPVDCSSVLELCQRFPSKQPKGDNHTWILCERNHLIEIVSSLRKVLRNEYFYSSQFHDIKRLNVNKELSLHRAANTLRRIFADLFWHIEKCSNIHLWCVKNLSEALLPIYRSVFCILWRKNKVNPLLKVLNTTLQERYVNDATVNQFLSDFRSSINDECDNGIKQTLVQSSSRSILTKSLPAQMFFNRSITSDGIILACMTFPASHDSKRLQKLINLLSEIGQINLEDHEEQMCDSMRLRLRLFVRRVTNLLDEYKNESIYLVSFGVGSLLMLLSAIHILSLNNSRSDNNHSNRASVNGIICIGLPLIGLRGKRGELNDPLLSIPALPILFIIGAKSRFGGHKEAIEFRKKLFSARRRQRQIISQNNNNDSNPLIHRFKINESCTVVDDDNDDLNSISPTFDLLLIGDADHLLRMQPSACKRWCTTQGRVDIRIINAIKNFIRKTKIQSSEKLPVDFMLSPLNTGSNRRPQFSMTTTTTRP
ncbi:unnamed protein product [Schistosoma turkestanicum]|nr:unnamed protein product [Schistosoma turkestanicum]